MADVLGSGVRNLFKYCNAYCGHDPQLIEQDIFKFILPLTGEATPQVTEQAERTTKKAYRPGRTEKIGSPESLCGGIIIYEYLYTSID
ncbi:MAG TPA: hypothetical protein VJ440_09780 [Candidatus Brocadiaceae bacterium]|nr:hypothetical protein [Candidatus Brocadiaceae bacterium]